MTPEAIRQGDQTILFVHTTEQAVRRCEKSIVIPDHDDKLPAEYCTDFWCYPMFRNISQSMKRPLPTGTMGLCIDKNHPALRLFPTDDYTTPPWYAILKTAHCEPVHHSEMIVQMIDNWERCRRFGLLYLERGCLHLTARLWEAPDRPEVKWFAASLLQWLTRPDAG